MRGFTDQLAKHAWLAPTTADLAVSRRSQKSRPVRSSHLIKHVHNSSALRASRIVHRLQRLHTSRELRTAALCSSILAGPASRSVSVSLITYLASCWPTQCCHHLQRIAATAWQHQICWQLLQLTLCDCLVTPITLLYSTPSRIGL